MDYQERDDPDARSDDFPDNDRVDSDCPENDCNCFVPAVLLLAEFNRSTSFNVSERNLPGGTSSVSGP
jgi:hypothetical protein